MTRHIFAELLAGILMVAIVAALPAALARPSHREAPSVGNSQFNSSQQGEGGEGSDEYSDEADTADTEEEVAEEEQGKDDKSGDQAKEDKSTSDKADKKDEAKEEKPAGKSDEKAAAKGDEKAAGKSEEKAAAKADEKAAVKQEKSDAKAAKVPPPKKRKTFKVEPKKIKVEVPLDGVFVARKMEEVVLRPETWTGYEIKEIVEHGAKVHKGQVLVKFDDDRINETIADLELDQRINELAIMRAEEELPRQERTVALNLENAERRNKETKEDFDRYNDIDRPQYVKQYAYLVKKSTFDLDYEKEELEQLEKMYKADDLTEATEEVILKRQRNMVDFAEFSLSAAKLRRNEVMDILLPRLDIEVKQSLESAEISLARAKMASSIDVNRARYELEQRKQTRAHSLERHAKLLKDRGLMEIKAPADGTVYYGQCVDGRWSDMASLINRLKPHGNVSAGTVIMTIIETRPLFVQANVDEAKRPEVSTGQKVKITPPAEGAARLDGKVTKVSSVPTGAGRFAVEFELEADGMPDWIVAGMSCKTRTTTYDKADALLVPKAAVHADDDDEDIKFVWRVDPDDDEAKPERRNVTTGKSSGANIEIVKGLKKNDVISLDDESGKPKEPAAAAAADKSAKDE